MANLKQLVNDTQTVVSELEAVYTKADRVTRWYNSLGGAGALSDLGDDDLLPGTGVTKAQYISAVNVLNQLTNYLTNGTPVQGDYITAIDQIKLAR